MDALAVPAQHAIMSAKTRVELIFTSPSIENRRQNHFQLLHMGKWHLWAILAGTAKKVSIFIVITTGKHQAVSLFIINVLYFSAQFLM